MGYDISNIANPYNIDYSKVSSNTKKSSGWGDFFSNQTTQSTLSGLIGGLTGKLGEKERANQYQLEAQKLDNERAKIEADQKRIQAQLQMQQALSRTKSTKKGISTGAIIGIVGGAMVLTTLVVVLVSKRGK